MASLTSGKWTIGYPSGDKALDTSITPRKRYINLKMTIASGEWPSGGVKLPGYQSVGLRRNLDYYMMSAKTATASGKTLFFSLTSGHKVVPYTNILASGTGRTFQALATTITVASKIFHMTVVGW